MADQAGGGQAAAAPKYITGGVAKNVGKGDPRYKMMEPKEDKTAGDSKKPCSGSAKKKKPFEAKAGKNGPDNKLKAGTGKADPGKAGPLKGGVGIGAPKNPLKGGADHTPSSPLKTGTHETPPHTPPGHLTPMTPHTAPLDHPKPPLKGALTKDVAQQLFKELAGKKDYIPFDYPDDCCYSRAEEMCRLLEAKGIPTNKIWIFDAPADRYYFQNDTNAPPPRSSLVAKTTNHPSGQVRWWYHVATVVQVEGPDGKPRDMVFDPSLFDHPVTPQEWAKSMNNPNAKPRIGHRDWYSPGEPVTAQTHAETLKQLQIHANSRAHRRFEESLNLLLK